MKTIRIECDAKLMLPLSQLTGIQGDLKTMDKADFERLVKSFEQDGIDFTFHVWRDKAKKRWYMVDGHGRGLVLRELLKRGTHSLPKEQVPCTETFAKTLKEARRKILRSSSVYHKMTNDGLHRFMVDNGYSPDDLNDYALPDIDIPAFKMEFYDEPAAGIASQTGDKTNKNFDAYQSAAVKQIVLYFKADDYDALLAKLDELLEKWKLDDHSQAVWKAVHEALRVA